MPPPPSHDAPDTGIGPGRIASCLSEATCERYLAGALSREETREVEAHLIQCRGCRELVLELPAPAPSPGHRPEPPVEATPRGASATPPVDGRSGALALSLTLVALAGAVAAASAVLEAGLPDPLGPSGEPQGGWSGVYAMALELVFVARRSAPVLFDLLLPVAVMASASALLSFGLSVLIRRIGGPGAKLLAALAIVAAPGEGRAHFGLHEHEDLVVRAGEVHPGTLVASARTVSVDGSVEGDLVVLTERLVLRGELVGNLFAVAREVDLRGVVNGSVFVLGERTEIGGEVRGDVYAGGESFLLGPTGRVGRDATLVADRVVLEGALGRDANAALADAVEIRGSIGRGLRGRAERIVLREGARIGGDVDASLPEGVALERSAGAQVRGEIREAPHGGHGGSELSRFLAPEPYAWMLLHVGAGFVLGMLLHALAPGILAVRAETPRDLLRGLGVGAATLVVAPLVLLVAAASVVGLPVALIGAAGLAAALYVGLVAVANRIGTALVPPGSGRHGGFGTALATGLAILVVLTHLPYLGDWLRGVAVVIGLGLLVEHGLAAWRARSGSIRA